QRSYGVPPAFRDPLELAVAVELVAEEVPQTDCAWPNPSGDVRECALVDLEEAQLGAASGEERGCDARDQVRACSVVRQRDAGREDRRRQRRGRRLPVRRRDDGAPEWQTVCER